VTDLIAVDHPVSHTLARVDEAPLVTVRTASIAYTGHAFSVRRTQYRFAQFPLPAYASGLAVALYWTASGSAADQVTWRAAVAAFTPGDTVRLTDKAFGASSSAVGTVGPIDTVRRTVITFADTDGAAADDFVVVKVWRDPDDAAHSGDAILLCVAVSY